MVDLLTIVAHPDDAALFAGGTIAKHADRGDDIAIAYMTAGELGGLEDNSLEAVAETRQAEAREAASVLGVDTVEFLGFEDGRVTPSLEHRLDLVETLRAFEPNVVITHFVEDPHPDHVATATLVAEATYMASLPLAPVEGDAHDVENVFHVGKSTTSFEPTTYVDVTGYLERKERALRCHESQLTFMADHDGIDEATYDLVADARADARVLGKDVGVRYAEGFNAMRNRPQEYLG